MKVSVKEIGPCRRELLVEVEQAVVDAELAKVTREIAQVANVAGFRKGKAPIPVVERRYARAIADEARDRLVPDSCREALASKSMDPVALVKVGDVSFGRGMPLSFSMVVDIPPTFKLPRYKGLGLRGNKIEVADAQVDDAVRLLRESAAVFEDVAGRAVREGDMAMVDYRAACEGKPVTEIVPDMAFLGKINGYWILVGSSDEIVPGLGKGIAGANIGETRDVNVAFPADYRAKKIAGKTAVYTVTVKGLREKKISESDDDLLKKTGMASIGDLRNKLRETLTKRAEAEETGRLKGEIVNFLLEKTSLDVPASMVDREARKIVQDIVMNSMRKGASQKDNEERQDDIVSSATKSSQDRVKLGYIVDRIAEEEKIEVTDAELDDYMKAMAAQYNVDKATLRSQLEKRGELESVKRSIRGEKALDFILREAKVKTK